MRTLEYMLKNWESIFPERHFDAKGEKYLRGRRKCRCNHPPIKRVDNNLCALCYIEKNKKEKEKEKLLYVSDKYKNMNIAKTLDQIKTGILYVVLGKVDGGSL